MLLSGVRSSCDMLARNSDLYLEVSASSDGLLLERAARLLDLAVLALHLRVLLGQLLRLLPQLVVGLLQLALLRLQFRRELLRLLQELLGLHRRLDAVEHDAEVGGELLEEAQVRRREVLERGQLHHGLDLALEQDREDGDAARQGVEEHRAARPPCRPARR